jgi:phage terminase small subunit
MPRTSGAELELVATVRGEVRSPPPAHLDEVAREAWVTITSAYPPGHFTSAAEVLLGALCQHVSLARYLNEQLDAMRHVKLNATTKRGAQERETYFELLKAAQDETRLIASLSGKLRLSPSSWRNSSRVNESKLVSLPPGPRPWDPM